MGFSGTTGRLRQQADRNSTTRGLSRAPNPPPAVKGQVNRRRPAIEIVVAQEASRKDTSSQRRIESGTVSRQCLESSPVFRATETETTPAPRPHIRPGTSINSSKFHAAHRWTSTGILQCVSTLTVSLPRTSAEMPWRPCEAMRIRSQPFEAAVSMIAR